MKKIIALILASALTLCLFSGCSSAIDTEPPETSSRNEYDDGSLGFGDFFETDDTTTTTRQEVANDDEVDTTPNNQNTTTTATAKEQTTTTTAEPVGNGYIQGSHHNGIYTSDFIGLTCELDSNWSFYSDAEIKQLNGITMDMMDEEIADKLKEAALICEMVATNASTGDSINVNLEKIPSTVSSSTTVESLLKSQFDILKDGLESTGATVDVIEFERFGVSNTTLDGIYIEVTTNGQKYYEKIACYKCNGYLVYITVVSSSFTSTSEILQNITIE